MSVIRKLPQASVLLSYELPPGWLYDEVVERLGTSGLSDFLLCQSLAGRLVATISGGSPARVVALQREAAAMGLKHIGTETLRTEVP